MLINTCIACLTSANRPGEAPTAEQLPEEEVLAAPKQMEARALISLCACLVAAQVEEEMQEEADMEQAEQVKEWGVWAPSTNSRAPAETQRGHPNARGKRNAARKAIPIAPGPPPSGRSRIKNL